MGSSVAGALSGWGATWIKWPVWGAWMWVRNSWASRDRDTHQQVSPTETTPHPHQGPGSLVGHDDTEWTRLQGLLMWLGASGPWVVPGEIDSTTLESWVRLEVETGFQHWIFKRTGAFVWQMLSQWQQVCQSPSTERPPWRQSLRRWGMWPGHQFLTTPPGACQCSAQFSLAPWPSFNQWFWTFLNPWSWQGH